jgi:hypothetical protein
MGRHSSDSQASFYRSFVKWLLPWLGVAVVVGIAVWVGVGALGQGSLDTPPPSTQAKAEASPSPDESPSPEPVVEDTPEPTPVEEPEVEETPEVAAPNGRGLAIQVLNGTGVASANDRVAHRLERMGYQIVNLEGASKGYSATTVYWSYDKARKQAIRLADFFGWEAGPKPDNLSTTVALHIIVGADEA